MAPALSWDTLLYMAKIDLELVPDSEMSIFFGKSIRDGISNRSSKPNNKYLKSDDPKQESKRIIY